jgi:SAM-dependent methyltransferase
MKLFKKMARFVFALLPTAWTNSLHAFKHRRTWNRRLAREYEKYFEQYETRAFLVDLLQQYIPEPSPITILEFGCSGGNNLKLFEERLDRPLRYKGIDISTAAVTFARATFPEAVFHEGDDKIAVELLSQSNEFDVFLASGILSYLPEPACCRLLQAAARRCRHLVLCDQLDRYDEQTGSENGVYHHPYGRLMQEAGWQAISETIPCPDGHVYSSVVARSLICAS